MRAVAAFQKQFLEWLGPDPNTAAAIVAERSGYTVDYVRWVAGLTGQVRWPGSLRFARAMARLGCTKKRWRDRPPEQVAQALQHRELLYDPTMRASA